MWYYKASETHIRNDIQHLDHKNHKKKHTASEKDSTMDFTFKMNKLKPHICEWLHHAWTKMFKQLNMWLSKGGKK
jgi:hypothetical protein